MGGIGGCIEKVETMEVSKESITTDTYFIIQWEIEMTVSGNERNEFDDDRLGRQEAMD